MEVTDPSFQGECTTPTGAALLAALTGGRAAPAAYTPVANGFGAGTRDPGDRPNVLRLILVEPSADPGAADRVLVVQCDVDDLPPEYVPPLLEAALAAGALDCSATPLLMKKGRPGLRVEALAPPERLDAVTAALFQAGSTIGVRWWPAARRVLARRTETVTWRGGEVRVKRSALPGGGERAKPEYEDVAKAAARLGITPLAAYRAMLQDGVAAEG
jgi:hypothetical protein